MTYKNRYEKNKLFQTWEIGYPDVEGWFNISSPKAKDKYLTVTKIGYYNELTMEIEGTVCSAQILNFYSNPFLKVRLGQNEYMKLLVVIICEIKVKPAYKSYDPL